MGKTTDLSVVECCSFGAVLAPKNECFERGCVLNTCLYTKLFELPLAPLAVYSYWPFFLK